MDASPPVSLADLDAGVVARVVAVPPTELDRLAAEGLHQGDVVEIETHLPLGGPVIVRLGRARVALARGVAGQIVVVPQDSR
jgi:Fe2+ transport system protein FeoA